MAALWRQPEFVDTVMRLVRHPQFERFKKMFHEPFYLLGHGFQDENINLTVSGSKTTNYNVRIFANGTFGCNCKDQLMTCKRQGMLCKHICFVIFRVFRLTSHVEEVFRTNKISLEKVQDLKLILESPMEYTNESMSKAATDALCYLVSRHRDFTIIKRRQDDCPICYDSLEDGDATLLGCPDCGNAVHKVCMERWLQHAPAKTCVMCRSSVWRLY
jgi:hypothetical protein